MNRPLIAAAVALGCIAGACYQDDATHPPPIAPTRVLLTDDPFPYDSVASVNVYVSRIEASTTYPFDTMGTNTWVEVAAPRKRFDLLTLQQGATAFVGEGTLDAGQYSAVRMTIDVDSSSIAYRNGGDAAVQWGGSGEMVMYAQVEAPLAVSETGAEIVLDFDLGRSFPFNLYGTHQFSFVPWLRAVNSAATGAIAGLVTESDIEGQSTVPVENADVTVFGGDPNRPSSWYVVATTHTGADGRYKVAFLLAGVYVVRIEQPTRPWLAPVTTPNVIVSVGTTTPLSALLPPAGPGGAFIHVTGPGTVGVGGAIVLHAAVWDSSGTPVASPIISWASRDDSIAVVVDSSYGDTLAFVLGVGQGTTWIVATSGALSDSVPLQVLPSGGSNPVASVTVTPATLSMAIGDSTFLQAVLRDSTGTILNNRPVSWYQTDSTGVLDLMVTVGPTAVLKAKHAGTTTVLAQSEGQWGSSVVTVH